MWPHLLLRASCRCLQVAPLEKLSLIYHGPSLLNPLRGTYLPSQGFSLCDVLVSPPRDCMLPEPGAQRRLVSG